MTQPLVVKPGKRIELAQFDPAFGHDSQREQAAERKIAQNIEVMGDLASQLHAEGRRALLLVLQGMDTSGKDGTIRHVLSGFNPLLCRVVPFKAPTEEELAHDFLWRVHREVPSRGFIGIFNRSHYEDVVAVRVRKLAPKKVWKARYDAINGFEQLLIESGTRVVKCFLHISKDEQRRRLQARLTDPKKRWKFQLGDLDDRKLWSKFQLAYDDALTKCNTAAAPWFIIPADSKLHRNLVISRILRGVLEEMDPRYPDPKQDLEHVVIK